MTRQEHLLDIAIEECLEVGQRISKALRFGVDEIQDGQSFSNRERIAYELNDLLTVLDMADLIELDHEGALIVDAVAQGEKQRKVEKYLAHSLACGTISD
jgi:hypothetical protein